MKLYLKEFGTKKLSWELFQPVPTKDVVLQANLKNALRDASSGEQKGLLVAIEFNVTGEGPQKNEVPSEGKPIYFRIVGECGALYSIDDVSPESFSTFARDESTINFLLVQVQPLITDVLNDALRRMGVYSVRSNPWLQGAEFDVDSNSQLKHESAAAAK